jgi:glycosyltransferase involved in cell wall biosynthesis
MAPQLDIKPDPTPEPTWVFMGHLGPAKGPQVAVKALARGAPGKLILVGGGPLAAQLQQRSIDQGLRIEFLGDQNGEERFDVLRQAWALILPSLCFENGPLVALEAFSIGIPVVASRIGSIPEYVTDGVSGRLFNPGDDEDLAHILTELASDATQRARLSSGAREVFRQRYAEREIAAQLEALLEATTLHSRNWGS